MEQIPTIPDDAPTVSFDINLGHDYRRIDFDYEAFASEAERIGLGRESAAELQINIEQLAEAHTTVDGDSVRYDAGVYHSYDHKLHVRTSWQYAISNYALLHEMGHAADRKSLLRLARMKRIGRLGVRFASIALLATGATMLADKIFSLEAQDAENVMQIGTIGLIAVAGMLNVSLGDSKRKSEEKANLVAKSRVHDVLKFQCRIHTNAEIPIELLEETERSMDAIRNQPTETLHIVSW